MKILAIETSCDETGMALVEAEGGLSAPRFKILKSLVASQIKIHEPFGGVVPNLAKREHLKNLPVLFGKLFAGNSKVKSCKSKLQGKSKNFNKLKYAIRDVDLITVTVGPGLEPALWTGIAFAEKLREEIKIKNEKIKIIGANHLEGHLYSFLLPKKTVSSKLEVLNSKGLGFRNWNLVFPAIALLVSGGHTILLLVKDLKTWKKLGETRDDAVGEAYDKVARLLKLPYPGGPQIEKLSRKGNPDAIEFPRPMIYDNSPAGEYDFSFSGLKTSVLYYLRDHPPKFSDGKLRRTSKKDVPIADVAASFQKAAIDVLVKKTLRAAGEFSAKSILLSGGVAANKTLRRILKKEAKKIGVNFLVAEQKYNTDNAVMIAAAGYMAYLRKKKYPLRANGNLEI